MALGRISAFSFPQYPVYVPPTETDWVAVHAGHSEIAPDATYTESDQDWTGLHTDYGDVYLAAEPEDEPLPDYKSMWAAAHAPPVRNLDDSMISSSTVSNGGTLSFTMQRMEDGPPPTEVKVNVLGTDISTWQRFPGASLTIDMAVPNMPPGTHTVEVLAYAGGRVVGTTQFTITVAAPASASPEPEPVMEQPEAEPPAPEEAPAPAPQKPVVSEPPARPETSEPPAETSQAKSQKFRLSQVIRMARASSAAVTEQPGPPEDSDAVSTGPSLGGQAMAAGLGIEAAPSLVTPAEAGRVDPVLPVVEASLGSAMGGDGGGGGQRQQPDETEEADAEKRTGSFQRKKG